MPEIRFKLDWYAGPSAQVEVFSPGTGGKSTYQLKYTAPFRSTIRPPVEELQLGPGELSPINDQLNQLVDTLDKARAATGSGPTLTQPQGGALDEMQMLGEQLHTLILPRTGNADIRGGGLFIEIGIDEALLSYPWELMHDGDDFLCLKHAIGRFVNSTTRAIPSMLQATSYLGSMLESLSILLISVPNPQPRAEGLEYESLSEAEAETKAICEVLAEIDGVKFEVLKGRDATYNEVFKTLNRNKYKIIHYNGHANFNEEKRFESGLVLFDKDMTTGALSKYFARSPPILCFINACETTRPSDKGWKDRYDVFGLAEAFLATGAYLLGSRWKVNDKAAAGFAKTFYKSLLQEGEPLGRAVLQARKVCKEESPLDEFAWANYTLYGDPRVCFRKIS
jgi:CHAT domain-containing protein